MSVHKQVVRTANFKRRRLGKGSAVGLDQHNLVHIRASPRGESVAQKMRGTMANQYTTTHGNSGAEHSG